MREIRFRAWDNTYKQYLFVKSIMFQKDGEVLVHCLRDSGRSAYLDGKWLETFTGLKDKNGKEAYHHDITQDEDDDRYIIEWDDESACFYLKGIGLNCLGQKTEDLFISEISRQQIIGSIHTNPELLNPEKERK